MMDQQYSRSRLPGQKRRRFAAGLLLAWLLGAGACAPPDQASRLPPPLPQGFLDGVHPNGLRTLAVATGVAHYQLNTLEQPWSLHLLRVELGRCELGLKVLSAPKQDGMAGGRSRVTELVAGGGEGILAAVNADFFTPEGLPVGTEVKGGNVRQVRARPGLAWRPGGEPWMGMPRAEGDSVLVLGWRVDRDRPDGETELVGGFPLLLQGGQRVGDLGVSERPSFSAARHPRTAVGFDPGQGVLWILVVDGRQPGHSDGMSLPELTTVLESLGVTEAVNLDGGGSTVLVLKGVTVNQPSDAEGERPVVNALAVRRDPSYCRPPR